MVQKQGYYEKADPKTGKAKKHQENALKGKIDISNAEVVPANSNNKKTQSSARKSKDIGWKRITRLFKRKNKHRKSSNRGWELIAHLPRWIDYDKLNHHNPNIPGKEFTTEVKGKHYRYMYVTYRGWENHGHGSDSWEKYYRRKRGK